jgi:CIC family chloride channel protein
MAVFVGAGVGGGAIVFRWLIEVCTRALSGHVDYSDAGHAINPHVPWLGPYFVIFAPMVAGALYGPIVHRWAREARGHGVPEVMLAVARRGGRISWRVALVKSLASALCIGGGGSVGREGPIVQIGSALGSAFGTLLRLSENRLRLLVACGAAGGISATFNAPLAGVFFASELILREFTAESFGVVVLSSVTAAVVGRAAFGDVPFLQLPAFTVQHGSQYLWFALLGVCAGAVGVLFCRVLYWIEDACDWAWRGPEWLRPAVGGVLLGGLLLLLPQLYGVGYPVLERAVGGGYLAGMLLVLLIGKILATSLTIGIGGSGGVFAPSLYIGAMAGVAYADVLGHIAPEQVGLPGAYGLIGMGAVFAGATRAPITGVIIVFELTGEYSLILPLMTAIVLATIVSRALSRDTIYTLKLRRRGIDLDQASERHALTGHTVADAMEPPPVPLTVTDPVELAATRLAASPHGILPVLDSEGRYVGTVRARTVAEALAEHRPGRPEKLVTSVGEITNPTQPLRPDTELPAALDALIETHGAGLPVLTPEPDGAAGAPVGWITYQAVLAPLRGN